MKILLIILVTCSSFAGVRKIQKEACTEYRVDNEITKSSQGQDIISTRNHYGLYINNMKINFDERNVSFDLNESIVMGFNKKIIKISIDETHRKFDEFTNLLQKDLYLFSSVCVDIDANLVDFEVNK